LSEKDKEEDGPWRHLHSAARSSFPWRWGLNIEAAGSLLGVLEAVVLS
jgi:hypothetical protein